MQYNPETIGRRRGGGDYILTMFNEDWLKSNSLILTAIYVNLVDYREDPI